MVLRELYKKIFGYLMKDNIERYFYENKPHSTFRIYNLNLQ